MDVPSSFGAVGSDGEEDGLAGEEEDNGEDIDEGDSMSINDEPDEQMSDTLLSGGGEDTWPFLQQAIWQGGVPLLTFWTARRPIHSFRIAVVGFVTSIELQFQNELVAAAEAVMTDFCPCAAASAMVNSAFSPS